MGGNSATRSRSSQGSKANELGDESGVRQRRAQRNLYEELRTPVSPPLPRPCGDGFGVGKTAPAFCYFYEYARTKSYKRSKSKTHNNPKPSKPKNKRNNVSAEIQN